MTLSTKKHMGSSSDCIIHREMNKSERRSIIVRNEHKCLSFQLHTSPSFIEQTCSKHWKMDNPTMEPSFKIANEDSRKEMESKRKEGMEDIHGKWNLR